MTGERDFSSRPRRRRTSWADLKRARQHVVDLRRQSEAAQARLRTLESRSAPTAALATQALLSEEAAPPRVLADLSGLMPADVKLESMSLTYGEAIAVQMQVSSRTAGSYDGFLQRLEGSPLFDDVVPGEETRDGGVSASITARYRGPR